MNDDASRPRSIALGLLAALLSIGASGCVESSLCERTALALEDSRRESALQARHIQVIEGELWRLAQVERAREEAARRALSEQLRELDATTAAVALAAEARALADKGAGRADATGPSARGAMNVSDLVDPWGAAPGPAAVIQPGATSGGKPGAQGRSGALRDPWRSSSTKQASPPRAAGAAKDIF